MTHFLFSVQLLCLAVIVGGGLVLGGGVRPLFIKAMKQPKAVHELESLNINVWTTYNRFSLIALIIFLLAQVISLIVVQQFHVVSMTLSVILILLFLLKIRIDSRLKNRALENPRAADTVKQKKDHKLVEYLSIVILTLCIIDIFLID